MASAGVPNSKVFREAESARTLPLTTRSPFMATVPVESTIKVFPAKLIVPVLLSILLV